MQTGPTAFQRGSLLVRCPMLTVYSWALIAATDSDVGNPMTQFGFVNFYGMTGNCIIMAALADEARFFGLRQVPRIRIQGANYPHEGSAAADVPEFYNVYQDETALQFTPPNQAWCDQFNGSRPVHPTTGVNKMTFFNCPSGFFTNAQLKYFGVDIREGQARNVLVGVTGDVHLDFQLCYSVPQSLAITGSSGTSPAIPWNFDYTTATGATTYEIAGQPVRLVEAAVVRDYNPASVKKILNLPAGAYWFKNASNASTTIITGELREEPVEHRMVSAEPPWGLKEAVMVEVKEEKKETRLIRRATSATQFVNEVVMHTVGSIASADNNVAPGGLIPEATTRLPEREAVLDSVIWHSTDAVGTVLGSWSAPFGMINEKSSQPAFDAAVYWTGNPCLTCKITPNQYMSGQLVLIWAPMMNQAQASAMYGFRLPSVMMTRSAFLLPNVSSNVALEAPFMYPKHAIKLSDTTETLGTFLLVVFNRLRIGANAPVQDMTITVYGSFLNNKFSVLNPNVVRRATGGYMSKVNNYNFSQVQNASVDATGQKDDFKGGNSDVSANDRPFCSLNPPAVRCVKYGNLSTCSDIDIGAMLALEPASLPSVSLSDTTAPVDEMDLNRLLRMDSYMGVFSINSSAMINDVLYTQDLCPGSEFFGLLQGQTADLSLPSYIALPATYWKGDIVFTFEFLASTQVLSVMFCSAYGVDGSGADIQTATAQYVVYASVSGPRTRVTVKFPWTSDTPLKKVPNGTFANGIAYSPGAMYVRLVAPMQTNELVSDTIDCNVYMRLEGEVFSLGNSGVDAVPADVPVLADL